MVFSKKRRKLLSSIIFQEFRRKFQGFIAETDSEVTAVRRVHASQYLKKGLIKKSDLNDDQTISMKKDKYYKFSKYFGVREKAGGRVVVSVRLLVPLKSVFDLQATHLTELNSKEVQFLSRINKDEIVEISALSKIDGTNSIAVLGLYGFLLKYSKKNSIRYWIFIAVEDFERIVVSDFGSAITKFGTKKDYLDTKLQPYIVDISGEKMSTANRIKLFLLGMIVS